MKKDTSSYTIKYQSKGISYEKNDNKNSKKDIEFTGAGNRRRIRHLIYYKYIFIFLIYFLYFIIYLIFIIYQYWLFISLFNIRKYIKFMATSSSLYIIYAIIKYKQDFTKTGSFYKSKNYLEKKIFFINFFLSLTKWMYK